MRVFCDVEMAEDQRVFGIQLIQTPAESTPGRSSAQNPAPNNHHPSGAMGTTA
jgi:hypothetical protein